MILLSKMSRDNPPQGSFGVTRRILLIPLLLIAMMPAIAVAEDSPIVGTWKLKSFVREVAGTGERYNQMGEHPDGYIMYSADRRMLVLFVSADQPRPHCEPTDDERIKLHKGMLAYGGTYTLSPGKVVHHVDIEWDGRRLGTDQVRFYSINGDMLVIKTEPNKSPFDGRERNWHSDVRARQTLMERASVEFIGDVGLKLKPSK